MRQEGKLKKFKTSLALKMKGPKTCGQILKPENAPQPTANKATGASDLQLQGNEFCHQLNRRGSGSIPRASR